MPDTTREKLLKLADDTERRESIAMLCRLVAALTRYVVVNVPERQPDPPDEISVSMRTAEINRRNAGLHGTWREEDIYDERDND